MSKHPDEWEEEDLQALVRNGVEEGLDLEYKRCATLNKEERHKDEIGRDTSAFANSAGGTIVYGMIEDPRTHRPTGLDKGFDPSDISKEWLENVIHQRVKPKIDGLRINPVTLSGPKQGRVAYVVSIPQSSTAHQAPDKKYYKRYNFKREAMEDYEVRDVMNRLKHPLLVAEFAARFVGRSGSMSEFALKVTLKNYGSMCARDWKLVLYIPFQLSKAVRGFDRQKEVEIDSPVFGKVWFENSLQVEGRPVFPEDEVEVSSGGKFEFTYRIDGWEHNRIEDRAPFLLWKTFADDMPPQNGEVRLSQIPWIES